MKSELEGTDLKEVNFDEVSGGSLPASSLLLLTGDQHLVSAPPGKSGLEARVAAAAVLPLNQLTCGQVRLLVGQQIGLRWLAKPVAAFCATHSLVQCDLFPGDLTVSALKAWKTLFEFAPAETRLMISADLNWIAEDVAETGDPFFKEALENLSAARTAICG